jgi:hypothetical protein
MAQEKMWIYHPELDALEHVPASSGRVIIAAGNGWVEGNPDGSKPKRKKAAKPADEQPPEENEE